MTSKIGLLHQSIGNVRAEIRDRLAESSNRRANGVVLCLVGSPLLLLEYARNRSRWIDDHHEGLRFVLWFFTLAAVYIWALPWLGLVPNWRVLEP